MSEQTYSIDDDLKEAQAMAKGLEQYLPGSELYGRVGGGGLFGGGSMPSLTVGALLMRLRRLRLFEQQMSADQRAKLADIETQHAAAHKEWRRHYEEKLLREANSRLDAMRNYFEEVRDAAAAAESNYRPEILRRTIVQEILIAMEELGIKSAELTTKARSTDSRLRSVGLEESGFLWADALQSAYPQQEYWWLYRKPRARR